MIYLRELLLAYQWSRPSPSLRVPTTNYPAPTCPICRATEKHGEHDEECWLGDAITEAEKLNEQLETAATLTKETLARIHELASELNGRMEETNEAMHQFRQRVRMSLEWMCISLKYQHDQTHDNLEVGSQGGYSKELVEALALLEELKGDT